MIIKDNPPMIAAEVGELIELNQTPPGLTEADLDDDTFVVHDRTDSEVIILSLNRHGDTVKYRVPDGEYTILF